MKRRTLYGVIAAAGLAAAFASRSAEAQTFRFHKVSHTSIQLSDHGQPVYVYNYGVMLAPGVPEDRARCCYIHPLYSPKRVVVTDDFPKDHYHHRGVFWAWPVVEVEGQPYDLWLMRGIRKRFHRVLAQRATSHRASLAVEVGWYLEKAPGRPVVREQVEVVTLPVVAGTRELQFTLRLEALEQPVRINGMQDGKGYGGFCVRFAPRSNTVIQTDTGLESQDSDMVPHTWAELSGQFQAGPAKLRIEIDPGNPGYPNGWCLRHYGFLGVNFPGMSGFLLEPHRPLVLRYRVLVQ